MHAGPVSPLEFSLKFRESTGVSLLGITGPWSPITPQGNPTQSAGVKHWRKGHGLHSWRHGYQESSAVLGRPIGSPASWYITLMA